MSKYGYKMVVSEAHLTKRDIALQARTPDGVLAGFVWVGLMANNTVAYMDKVCIDPHHHHKGVLQALYAKAFKLATAKGAKEALGFIRQDAYHDASCVQALRMAFGADSVSYTLVSAQAAFILSERPDLAAKE
jgi:L-amino acid N-acyltransferase YncA